MSLSTRRLRILTIIAAVIVTCFYYLRPGADGWGYGPPLPLSTHKPPPNDGKVHWVPRNKDRYPVTSFIPLPTGTPAKIPKIQAEYKPEAVAAKEGRLKRQAAVKESFMHSWEGYKTHAWLRDEVVPIAGGYRDTFGGWAATLVDALDTLWIMGMKEDFEIAVNSIEEIDFTTTEAEKINVFETTIRYLGGFLAAYDISGEKYPVLLSKAIEVGDLLMSCFDTPNRMPITRWDWQ
jgi:mannosyl-oligosaccharide alpha-1,2-mannosidase